MCGRTSFAFKQWSDFSSSLRLAGDSDVFFLLANLDCGLASPQDVVQSPQMEHKIAQSGQIDELEGSLVFLLGFFRSILVHHDIVQLIKVEEDSELVIATAAFDLESFQGG